MGAKQHFRYHLVKLVQYTNSKRIKVLFWAQKISIGTYILVRITNHKGGPGNPSAPIGFNGKSTTNFWC